MTNFPETREHDRNLLFGVLAVQLHYVTPEQLAKATGEWKRDPTLELGRVLVEQGDLSESRHELVVKLLESQVELHGNLASALASSGGERAVHESFAASLALSDSFLAPSLVSFGGVTAPGEDAHQTQPAGAAIDNTDNITIEHPGRYTIKSEYDRGGIGRIMLAFDEHIGREVALKELLPEPSHSGTPSGHSPSRVTVEAAARFLREARITGQLGHPGIVPVYEIAKRADGTLFYTMKFVRGKTLSDLLKHAASLSERLKLLPQFLHVCEAVAYAHSKGVIHRDLKPQNIMIGEFGETVVLDWGLAKIKGLGDLEAHTIEKGLALIREAKVGETLPGSPIGTPSYMSPEQADGRLDEIDERSDVWGLGVILFEMLTGVPPYLGRMARDVMLKVIIEPAPPVRELEPHAPVELCVIAEKCMNKAREKRYADAEELTRDVAKVVLEIFGPSSFLQVREERNIALEQMRIAEEQRALAEQREREARENLAEAYFQYGLRAEQDNRWAEAKIYYAQALALTAREDAREGLCREPIAASQTLSIASYAGAGEDAETDMIYLTAGGKFALTAGGANTIMLWSLTTGEYCASFAGHSDKVLSARLSPDGKYLLSGSADHTLNLWLAGSAQFVRTCKGHRAAVTSVAFSPDGSQALSASRDGTLRLWSIADGSLLAVITGHQGPVFSAGFSADGKYALTAGADRTARLFSLEDKTCVAAFTGHEGEVHFAAFSPRPQIIFTASEDKTVRSWSLATGKCLKVFPGHEAGVFALGFSPDGKHFVSGGSAGEDYFGGCVAGDLKLWEAETGRCLRTVTGHQREVIAVRFLPDGQTVVSGSRDNTIKFWPLDWELFELCGSDLLEKTQEAAGLKLEGFNLVPLTAGDE